MKPLLLKKEWIVKCLNCGNDAHCGEILKRTEKGYASEGSKEHEIIVCTHCRCEVEAA